MSTTTINKESWVRDHISQNGLTGYILKVNSKIDSTRLNVPQRSLISQNDLYADCLYYAFNEEKVDNRDVDGIYQSVMRRLNDLVRTFYRTVTMLVLKKHKIDVNNLDPSVLNVLYSEVYEAEIPINSGDAENLIMEIFNEVQKVGPLRKFVDEYLKAKDTEVNTSEITEEDVEAMVEYLQSYDIVIPSDIQAAINNHLYDEYMALALDYAKTKKVGGSDPAVQYWQGGGTSWDFSIDTTQDFDELGIVPKNIKAAAALFYTYVLGEELNIYYLADELIRQHENGRLHITDGELQMKLYRYYRLSQERANHAERAMLFKRVLNLGQAELLEGTVVNNQFSNLWGKLLNEVAEYKQDTASATDKDYISVLPIYQLIREIQYNLTTFMTGMAHIRTAEAYNHLKEAESLLGHKEIINHYASGRPKNKWYVIDGLHQEVFGAAANVTGLRTAAEAVYKMLRYIASFNESMVDESEFEQFVVDAETYIIVSYQHQQQSNGSYREEDEFSEIEEEFDEWEA